MSDTLVLALQIRSPKRREKLPFNQKAMQKYYNLSFRISIHLTCTVHDHLLCKFVNFRHSSVVSASY